MLEVAFGPDGVGKYTYAYWQQRQDRELVVLRGTNPNAWFDSYPDLMQQHGIEQAGIPPDDQFEARMQFVNAAAIAITGARRRVLIDGHPLHKTVVNIAAGLSSAPTAPERTSVATLVGDVFCRHFQALFAADTIHRYVTLPPALPDDYAARILQARMHARGELSPWDPANTDASRVQVIAARQLARELGRRGAQVVEVVSNPTP